MRATGIKAVVTRQKNEAGDYSDRLHNDAHTSGPKLHPAWYSFKSMANVRVCLVMHDKLRILHD